MKNKNKYTYLRFLNYLKGFILGFLFIFIPKKKKRIILTSTVNMKYSYNSKYLFEYLLHEYPEYEIKYLINDDEKREKLREEMGNHFISTKTFKGTIYCLLAYTWITSVIETPLGGTFLRLNRLVIHLGHGTPLKNIGFLEKNISVMKRIYYSLVKTNFSYVLSTSKSFDTIMMNFLKVPKNRILTAGQPRNDTVFWRQGTFLKDTFKIKEEEKNILYAPTWRQNEATSLFPFEDFNKIELENYLKINKINIFLRLHPNFERDVNIEKYVENNENIYILKSDLVEEITEYLSCFDLLITDYSSIFIDYLLLKKPVAFIPYDYEKYNKEIGFTVDYYEHTPGPKIKSLQEFKEEIIKLLKDKDYYLNERIKENNFYNLYQDNKNCKRIVEFIINKIN